MTGHKLQTSTFEMLQLTNGAGARQNNDFNQGRGQELALLLGELVAALHKLVTKRHGNRSSSRQCRRNRKGRLSHRWHGDSGSVRRWSPRSRWCRRWLGRSNSSTLITAKKNRRCWEDSGDGRRGRRYHGGRRCHGGDGRHFAPLARWEGHGAAIGVRLRLHGAVGVVWCFFGIFVSEVVKRGI